MLNVHGVQDGIKGAIALRGSHLKRLLEAWGENVVKYITDFVTLPVDDTTGDPTEWTLTVVEAGGGGDSTMTQLDGSGGKARIETDNADNDGVNAQLNGESFELTTDQHLYFGAFGVTINDVDQTDLFLGLAITDTDILGGVTDSIGFRSVDGSAALNFVVEKDSTETEAAAIHTLVDATAVDLEFYWDGDAQKLEVFVDGVSVATPAITNLPDNEALRVSWHFLTGETTANTCDIDALRVIQIGR